MKMSNNKENQRQTAKKSTGAVQQAYEANHDIGETSVPVKVRARDPLERRSLQLRNSLERTQIGIGRGKGGRIRMLESRHREERRKRKNTIRLRRLRQAQETLECKNSIPFAAFNRAVREVLKDIEREMNSSVTYRFQMAAIQALRDASEGFITNMFEACSLFVAHANRVTLMPKDMELAKRIWNGSAKK